MKHILKVIIFGVCLGLLLAAVQPALHIDRDVFMHWYWIAAPAVVAGALVINVIYNIPYQRKMKELAVLLDAERPEEYLSGVENLLRTARGKGLQNILKINLSAGYLETKQYNKAVQLLEELSRERLGSVLKLCCCLNLGLGYFYTKQYTRAIEVYTQNQPLFDRYRNHTSYGGSIALADVLTSAMRGQSEQALQQLAAARKKWDIPRFRKTYQEIEDILSKGAL